MKDQAIINELEAEYIADLLEALEEEYLQLAERVMTNEDEVAQERFKDVYEKIVDIRSYLAGW